MTVLANPADTALVPLHGRRLGLMGDGQTSGTQLLQIDNAVVASSRSGPPPLEFIATSLTGAGTITLAGAVVGDDVFKVYDMNVAPWVDVTANFEPNISVTGQIKQTASMSAHAIMIKLRPMS